MLTTTQEMQEILANDPLVGDTACQNRAVYLAYLARKVRRNKPLTQQDLDFIENCRELTTIKDTQRDEFGVILSERSKDVDAMDAVVFPDDIKSRNKKQKCIAEKKRDVALASMTFMANKTRGMQFFSPIPNPDPQLTRPAAIGVNGVGVPVLPFYVSVKMMLNIVNRKAIDIVAIVTRIQGDSNEDRIPLGKAMVLYTKEYGQYRARQISAANYDDPGLIKEAIKVEFVSKVRANEPKAKDQKEGLVMFNNYLSNFMQKDILKLILLYAGNHSVYADNANVPGGTVFMNPVTTVTKDMMFNINACSLSEYAALNQLANDTGIERDVDYVDHVSVTSRSLP